MFHLKIKDKYEKVNFWKKQLSIFSSILLASYFLISFFFFITYGHINTYIFNLILLLSLALINVIINVIISLFLEFYFRKQMTIEMLDILKTTKLPSKLPKVVYVYTAHNDFGPERLLQSMKQSYPNIEYGISDGSSDPNIIKKIKEFALKYNVNYYSLNRSSIHKADNLNHFLKYSGVQFDYLLISDADVAIDKNFVSTSLKFFYTQNQKRLGGVSSIVQNYKANNLFTNSLFVYENIEMYDFLNKNFKMSEQTNLQSATTLLKKEMIEEFNYQFPNSCLEDFWLETLATRKYWAGLINPFSISLQAFDSSIYNNRMRILRVNDGNIKLYKEHFYINQNEMKILTTNSTRNKCLVSPWFWVLTPILLSIIIFLFINFYDVILPNYQLFGPLISLVLISLIIIFISSVVKLVPFVKGLAPIYLILIIIYCLARFGYNFYRFLRAFFCSKYADFQSSSKSTLNKTQKWANIKKIKNFIYAFFILSVIIISIEIPFILTHAYDKNLCLSFLFIFLNVVFGGMGLSTFCFLVLYSFSFIKVNRKYDKSEFVYCTNKFVKQEKTINKGLDQNNLKREDILS